MKLKFAFILFLLPLLLISGCPNPPTTGFLELMVFDAQSTGPLAGAIVDVYTEDNSPVAQRETDGSGRVLFELDGGYYYFTVTMAGYESYKGEVIKIVAGTTIGTEVGLNPEAPAIELYDARGYPYDPTNTTGIYDYVVTITADGTKLQNIKIVNSREKWGTNDPLYPTTAGQSLTGKPGKTAVFGNALAEGTLGKGFSEIEFKGFDSGNSTDVKLGKDCAGADSRAKGCVAYRGADDLQHTIPFMYELSNSGTAGDSFVFDGKTIWFKTDIDANAVVKNGDYLNGNLILDINYASRTSWAFKYGSRAISSGGKSFAVLDDVNYIVSGGARGTIYLKEASGGRYVQFRKENSTGTLISNILGDSTDDSYGKIFYTTGMVFDAAAGNAANLALPGLGGHLYYYAFKVTSSRVFLMLDADRAGSLGNESAIQYGHKINFWGTAIPDSSGVESNKYIYSYYVPKDADFNSQSIFSNANAYFVAVFQLTDSGDVGLAPQYNIYIDTADGGLLGPFPNANLSYFLHDVQFNSVPNWSLTSGSASSYLKAAYSDTGAKVILDDANGMAVASIRQNSSYTGVTTYLYGPGKISRSDHSVYLHSEPGSGAELEGVFANYTLPELIDKTINYKVDNVAATANLMEKIGVVADAKFDVSSDIKDLVAYVESGQFYYLLDLSAGGGIDFKTTYFKDTGADDQVTIVLFGQQYEIVEAQLTGTKMLKLKKV